MSAKKLTNHPLYTELISIGTKKKSIRPSALMGCEQLLTSPEVLRRAGVGASQRERAEHASQALKDLIGDIAEQRDRVVAEAALGAGEDYEGLRIGERQGKLFDLPRGRITHDVFKVRRRHVFETMVEELTRDEPTPTPTLSITQAPAKRQRSPSESLTLYLRRMLACAYDLHYAGLASLFMKEYRELRQLRPSDNRDPSRTWGHEWIDWDACARHMFEMSVAFATSGRSTLVEQADALRDWAVRTMKMSGYDQLRQDVATIIDSCPPEVVNRAAEQGVLAASEDVTLYWDVWMPWWDANTLSDAPGDVETITVTTAKLLGSLAKSLGTDRPAQDDAAESAIDAIGRSYGVNPALTMIRDTSLHQMAASYFARKPQQFAAR